MNDNVVIVYNGGQVSVPKEVADFLEQDRKREQAQEKQVARHLSKSEFETVPSGSDCVERPVEDAVLRNLRLENLRGAIAELDVQGQNLLSLRYSGELTMEDLRHLQNGGIKATENAAQKTGRLCLMTGLPSFFENFFCSLVYKRALSVLISRGKSAPPSEYG